MYCASLLPTIFASLARSNERVHFHTNNYNARASFCAALSFFCSMGFLCFRKLPFNVIQTPNILENINILRYYLSIHSQKSHSSENSLTLIAHQGEALSVKMRPFSLESEARWISQQSHRRKWDRVFSYLKRRLWDSGKIHNQTRAFHVKFNLQNRYRTHRFAQPAYLRLSRAPPKTTAGNTSAVKGHAIRAISVFNDTLYKKECISRMR